MNPPSTSRKFAFWLLIGMISVIFVEVPAGSTMFPFFTFWGMLVVLPLYLLHSVFLLTVVFRFGRCNFWTLYSAGTLFGMYEAYITKVLWISFRPEGPFLTVSGIALFETIILVLFLHPLLAFVVPMFFTEILCTNSSEIAQGLPARAQRLVRQHPAWAVGVLMALLGLMQFVNSPSVLKSFLSGAGNSLVLGLALLWWRRTGGAAYSLRELLPGSKGLRNFGILLLCFYLFWGFAIKPKSIPAVWPGQLTIWLIYAGLGWVFFRCLRRSAQGPWSSSEDPVAAVPLYTFSWRGFVLACALASVVTTLARLFLFPFVPVQILCMFSFFVGTGIALLGGLLIHVRQRV
jgi:hypothetical protein